MSHSLLLQVYKQSSARHVLIILIYPLILTQSEMPQLSWLYFTITTTYRPKYLSATKTINRKSSKAFYPYCQDYHKQARSGAWIEFGMSDNITETLLPQQRRLWSFLCWSFPDRIRQVLESKQHVHSNELHALYLILTQSKGKTPGYMLAMIKAVSEHSAGEMLAALEDLNMMVYTSTDAEENMSDETAATVRDLGGKPLFHSAELEELWFAVNALFDGGFLGRLTDGSAQERVEDFRTLNLLFQLDLEDRRATRDEDIRLRCPDHRWYHMTEDREVEHMLQRIRPLLVPGYDADCIKTASLASR